MITHGGCRFQKCGGSLRGLAPDEGRGVEDKGVGLSGEITFLAVQYLIAVQGTWSAQVVQLSP